jgi:hypothetical protein
MTGMKDRLEELKQLLDEVDRAQEGESNDAEIEALQNALGAALEIITQVFAGLEIISQLDDPSDAG